MHDLINEVLVLIKERRGVDFRPYCRATLESQLALRMEELRCHDADAYLKRLREDPNECNALVDVLAINVSSFFRDPIVFEVFAQTVLPEIIERKKSTGHQEIRVWSAGCASGEEAYSIAILIRDALKSDAQHWRTYIFATDIDSDALRQALEASYPKERIGNVKFDVMKRYFKVRDSRFELLPEICEMVEFSQEDLTSPASLVPTESVFGSFDLILCRNVLIYFDGDLQRMALDKLTTALNSGGFLILGDCESLTPEIAATFDAVSDRDRIYRKTCCHKEVLPFKDKGACSQP